MSKKYLITKVIAGEKQGFLKNVTKDGGIVERQFGRT